MNSDNVIINEEVNDDSSQSEPKDNAAVLPDALSRIFILRIVIAVLTAAVSVVAAIMTKDATILGILLASAYLSFNALYSIRYRYMHGFIHTVPVICAAVQASSLFKNVRVSFECTDESHHMFQFLYGTKKSMNDFVVGAAYVIYFDINSPDDLIAYSVI